MFFSFPTEAQVRPISSSLNTVEPANVKIRTIRLPWVEGSDIRFGRLSATAGLSQTHVGQIVEDDQGFMWFGTQYGLNRYDGYNFRVFAPDPTRTNSLSGGFIYSLFKDRSGNLWIGCNQFLDRFDPATESFSHYRLETENPRNVPVPVTSITQDRSGVLWLGTGSGLYALDPSAGRITHHYTHDPLKTSSLSANDIKSTLEDRSGRFWVADGDNIELLDRSTGSVSWRFPLPQSVHDRFSLHEDRFGKLWIACDAVRGFSGLGALDPRHHEFTEYWFYDRQSGKTLSASMYTMLDDKKGIIWLGTMDSGLLKFDQETGKVIRYRHHPDDPDSLDDDRVISLGQDPEGNIWAGLQASQPVFFATRNASFNSLLRGALTRNLRGEKMVNAIYEDHQGTIWLGVARSLIRIDRTAGNYDSYHLTGTGENDVVSIIEDSSSTIWGGTEGGGLYRLDPTTGQFKRLLPNPSPSSFFDNAIIQLFTDHTGAMWLATWNGLDRFNPATQRFIVYKRDKQSREERYYDIAEDQNGRLWLGGNSGLQRFDPATGKFNGYEHQIDNPRSLSDNDVSSVLIDHSDNIWAATYNGLSKLDRASSTFTNYYARDGLPSSRVSCALEDEHGILWLSTARGVSRFDPLTETFKNYSTADGLPGMDLTGWRTCFKSTSGEMFFGGFDGGVSFFPDKVVDNSYIPPVVFTDFWLAGHSLDVGGDSPLKKSVTYTNSITLSHSQFPFALQFAALSYSSAAMNRYRYRLEGLNEQWNEVTSDQRVVNYSYLAPGKYTFFVQATTGQSDWKLSGAVLHIQVLPPWWSTWWFLSASAVFVVTLLGAGYQWRIKQLKRQERKLRDVIETIPTFAWTALRDGSVDFVNHHWKRFTGLSTAKTIGDGWQEAVQPDDLKRHVERWRASVETGEPFEMEVRYRHAENGQYRWFLTRAVPLRNSRGEIVKWYGTSTDIEDRKRAEQLQSDLAHVNRVSTMGELTASLAHDIKQPIGAAVTNAEACARFLDRDQPDVSEAREAALEMARDARHAGQIIDRVRSLYRKDSPHLDIVDVNEIIEEMVLLLRGESHRYAVSLRTDLADELPTITADRVQLQQVFMNLMLNGIESMRENGGELIIKSQLREDGKLQISVTDNGVGLPPEKADQIFNAFFTTKPQGTGLGLAITRSIVEAHGGRVWAVTNSERGTTFHFTLLIRTAVPA